MSGPGDDDRSPEETGDRRHEREPADEHSRHSEDSERGPAPNHEVRSPGNREERSASSRRDGPPPQPGGSDDELFSEETRLFVRDVVTSVLAVFLLGFYIFMISGVWPPMVAIESGSMEPNMEVNDLVVVMETERFQPGEAQEETGVVTAAVGAETGYSNYGGYGDVIVFKPDGNGNRTPVIHRAMFWVEEGENWFDRADEEFVDNADSCEEISDTVCSAPHDGFITKGDNNPTYDQTGRGNMEPVKPKWIVGTAEVRVPQLGWLRLRFG